MRNRVENGIVNLIWINFSLLFFEKSTRGQSSSWVFMNIFDSLINLNNPHQLYTAEALQIAFWAVTRCLFSAGRDVDQSLDLDLDLNLDMDMGMGLASIDLLKLLINAKKWKGGNEEAEADEMLWPLNGIRACHVKGVRRAEGAGRGWVSWLRSWQFHNCFHMQKIPVALERIISLASCVCMRLGLVSALRFHFIYSFTLASIICPLSGHPVASGTI